MGRSECMAKGEVEFQVYTLTSSQPRKIHVALRTYAQARFGSLKRSLRRPRIRERFIEISSGI
jgi:hypothetical protein